MPSLPLCCHCPPLVPATRLATDRFRMRGLRCTGWWVAAACRYPSSFCYHGPCGFGCCAAPVLLPACYRSLRAALRKVGRRGLVLPSSSTWRRPLAARASAAGYWTALPAAVHLAGGLEDSLLGSRAVSVGCRRMALLLLAACVPSTIRREEPTCPGICGSLWVCLGSRAAENFLHLSRHASRKQTRVARQDACLGGVKRLTRRAVSEGCCTAPLPPLPFSRRLRANPLRWAATRQCLA